MSYCQLCFSRMKVAEMDYDAKCKEIAEKAEGLSGREISKLGVAWQVRFAVIVYTIKIYLILACSRCIRVYL